MISLKRNKNQKPKFSTTNVANSVNTNNKNNINDINIIGNNQNNSMIKSLQKNLNNNYNNANKSTNINTNINKTVQDKNNNNTKLIRINNDSNSKTKNKSTLKKKNTEEEDIANLYKDYLNQNNLSKIIDVNLRFKSVNKEDDVSDESSRGNKVKLHNTSKLNALTSKLINSKINTKSSVDHKGVEEMKENKQKLKNDLYNDNKEDSKIYKISNNNVGIKDDKNIKTDNDNDNDNNYNINEKEKISLVSFKNTHTQELKYMKSTKEETANNTENTKTTRLIDINTIISGIKDNNKDIQSEKQEYLNIVNQLLNKVKTVENSASNKNIATDAINKLFQSLKVKFPKSTHPYLTYLRRNSFSSRKNEFININIISSLRNTMCKKNQSFNALNTTTQNDIDDYENTVYNRISYLDSCVSHSYFGNWLVNRFYDSGTKDIIFDEDNLLSVSNVCRNKNIQSSGNYNNNHIDVVNYEIKSEINNIMEYNEQKKYNDINNGGYIDYNNEEENDNDRNINSPVSNTSKNEKICDKKSDISTNNKEDEKEDYNDAENNKILNDINQDELEKKIKSFLDYTSIKNLLKNDDDRYQFYLKYYFEEKIKYFKEIEDNKLVKQSKIAERKNNHINNVKYLTNRRKKNKIEESDTNNYKSNTDSNSNMNLELGNCNKRINYNNTYNIPNNNDTLDDKIMKQNLSCTDRLNYYSLLNKENSNSNSKNIKNDKVKAREINSIDSKRTKKINDILQREFQDRNKGRTGGSKIIRKLVTYYKWDEVYKQRFENKQLMTNFHIYFERLYKEYLVKKKEKEEDFLLSKYRKVKSIKKIIEYSNMMHMRSYKCIKNIGNKEENIAANDIKVSNTNLNKKVNNLNKYEFDEASENSDYTKNNSNINIQDKENNALITKQKYKLIYKNMNNSRITKNNNNSNTGTYKENNEVENYYDFCNIRSNNIRQLSTNKNPKIVVKKVNKKRKLKITNNEILSGIENESTTKDEFTSSK